MVRWRSDNAAMNFAEHLRTLPSVAHLASLDLLDASGALVASIHNQPGQTGSLAVYHALAKQYGGTITPEAAALGLQWYGEHTADALANPGKHPNIDRLLGWAQGSESFGVQAVSA